MLEGEIQLGYYSAKAAINHWFGVQGMRDEVSIMWL